MPSPLQTVALGLVVALGLALGACGDEIGDSCTVSSDCSSAGDRICDTSAAGGYCTIIGCEFDSCPDESVCIRFYTNTTSNRTCDPAAEDVDADDCTADEACTLSGYCTPRNAESRFCMKGCDDDGDCRDEYECRDRALMESHGGEPVAPPGEAPDLEGGKFCAPAPLST